MPVPVATHTDQPDAESPLGDSLSSDDSRARAVVKSLPETKVKYLEVISIRAFQVAQVDSGFLHNVWHSVAQQWHLNMPLLASVACMPTRTSRFMCVLLFDYCSFVLCPATVVCMPRGLGCHCLNPESCLCRALCQPVCRRSESQGHHGDGLYTRAGAESVGHVWHGQASGDRTYPFQRVMQHATLVWLDTLY
jgi:hypothetical protein